MYELKKVDVWSVVKVTFILSFFLGLVVGVFYFILLLFISQFTSALGGGVEAEIMRFGGFIGFFVVFFIAIFISVFYTIISAILASLYNVISNWTGGVRINLVAEQVEKDLTSE